MAGRVCPVLNCLTIPEAQAMLTGLVAVDLLQLQQGVPDIVAPLRDGRVYYEPLDKEDEWLTLETVLRRGHADCEDLAAAYAASRTFRGHPSRVVLYRTGPRLFHAVVQDIRSGKIFDPSRSGGMGLF